MQTVEQLARWNLKRTKQAEQRGQPDLARAAFDTAHLHNGEPAALGKVLLRPATSKSSRTHILPELL